MKIIKKAISIICAVAMTVTMGVSVMPMISVSAQTFVQGFENGGDTYKFGSAAVSSEKAHSGTKSVKLTVNSALGSHNTDRVVYEDGSGAVSLIPGKEYRLCMWVYTDDSFVSKTRIVFDPDLNRMNSWVSGKGIDVTNSALETGKWVKIEHSFIAASLSAETQTHVSVGVAVDDGTVGFPFTVYIDDVSVTEVKSRDTLPLQGFENGGLTSKYGDAEISTDRAHSGEKSVKLTINGSKSNHTTDRVVLYDNNGAKSFSTGKKYEVSMWVYAVTGFEAKVKLISDPNLGAMGVWLANKGQDMQLGELQTGEWIKVTGTLEVVPLSGENATYLSVGVTACDGVTGFPYTVYIDDVSVTEIINFEGGSANIIMSGDDDNIRVGIDTSYRFSKTDSQYTANITGDYNASASDIKFGILTAFYSGSTAPDLIAGTAGVTKTECSDYTQDGKSLTMNYSLPDISAADRDKQLIIRPYMEENGYYRYGAVKQMCVAEAATTAYETATNRVTKKRLAAAFADSAVFDDSETKKLTFAVFSDFHYNPDFTASSLSDVRGILKRASSNNADFVISLGDFHNNALGSPELFNTYYNNEYGLKAYNIYGNHELEGAGNSMAVVTPNLTNDSGVVWGTADGKMNTDTGYYYFDKNGFRVICLDNNYYLDTDGVTWKHNGTASYGPPSGVSMGCSFGPVQTAWLETVLNAAAENDMPCLIMTHIPIDGRFSNTSGDAAQIRQIFKNVNSRKSGTVMAVFCGHEHMERQVVVDGILYKYINSVRSGYGDRTLQGTDNIPYKNLTFKYEEYDSQGNLLRIYDRLFSSLNFNFSYYSENALSSIVTVLSNGTIVVNGTESKWLNDEAPAKTLADGIGPKNNSLTFYGNGSLVSGSVHVIDSVYLSDDTGHWHGCGVCNDLNTDAGNHVYDADCTDVICNVCGYTRVSAHDMSITDKDGTGHWTVCSKCGITGAKTEHTYGGWSVTSNPTATGKGSRERACPVCGYTQHEDIAALGVTGDNKQNPDSQQPGGTVSPLTGDAAKPLLYMAVAVLCASLLGAAVLFRKKRHKKN